MFKTLTSGEVILKFITAIMTFIPAVMAFITKGKLEIPNGEDAVRKVCVDIQQTATTSELITLLFSIAIALMIYQIIMAEGRFYKIRDHKKRERTVIFVSTLIGLIFFSVFAWLTISFASGANIDCTANVRGYDTALIKERALCYLLIYLSATIGIITLNNFIGNKIGGR